MYVTAHQPTVLSEKCNCTCTGAVCNYVAPWCRVHSVGKVQHVKSILVCDLMEEHFSRIL